MVLPYGSFLKWTRNFREIFQLRERLLALSGFGWKTIGNYFRFGPNLETAPFVNVPSETECGNQPNFDRRLFAEND